MRTAVRSAEGHTRESPVPGHLRSPLRVVRATLVTAAGVAATAYAFSRGWTLLAVILGATASSAVFFLVYRPWHLRWGATDEEVRRDLPGDVIVAAPTFDATRAITVEAPPEAVWPWIAQIGFGRAGWYSYDLLDNLGRHSLERIDPTLEEIGVGDVVPMGPGGAGLRVKDLVPAQWMLWWDGGGYTTWLWHLEEIEPGRTRLITRVRMGYRWAHPSILFALLLIEPWDFPMMRKCMLGIKRRAESVGRSAFEGSVRRAR